MCFVHTWEYLESAGFEVRGWMQIYMQRGSERGLDDFISWFIWYKKYGKNLRATGGREVFFPNYLKLIRLVQIRGVCRCMRWKREEGGFSIFIS